MAKKDKPHHCEAISLRGGGKGASGDARQWGGITDFVSHIFSHQGIFYGGMEHGSFILQGVCKAPY